MLSFLINDPTETHAADTCRGCLSYTNQQLTITRRTVSIVEGLQNQLI